MRLAYIRLLILVFVVTANPVDAQCADGDCQDEAAPASARPPEIISEAPANPIRDARGADELIVAQQTVLQRLGLYTSGIDGFVGPGMRRAITAFEENEGLETDGWLSAGELHLLAQRYDQFREHGSVWAALDCPGPGCPSEPYSNLTRSFRVAAALAPRRTTQPQPRQQPLQPTTNVLFVYDKEAVVEFLELSVDEIHNNTVGSTKCALTELGYFEGFVFSDDLNDTFLVAAEQFALENDINFSRRNPFSEDFQRLLLEKYVRSDRQTSCGPNSPRLLLRSTGTGIFR